VGNSPPSIPVGRQPLHCSLFLSCGVIMRNLAGLTVAVLLGGCSGSNYLSENYAKTRASVISTTHDTWWVSDRPDRGKILVERNPASAAAQGVIGGLLFNPTVAAAPKPLYQEAAEKFLVESGRSCSIKDGYLVIEPSWEFSYECGSRARYRTSGLSPPSAKRPTGTR